jgi:3-hydroxyacyl-[acyl-carrier-protein] dehydratase
MLKQPIFEILATERQENTIHAVLEIDRHSEIFEGHFPGQPVVPGACMLQVVKEVLEKSLNTLVRLIKADNIKFLSLIEPQTAAVLQLDIIYQLTADEIGVNANLTAGKVVCMKLQGTFIKK